MNSLPIVASSRNPSQFLACNANTKIDVIQQHVNVMIVLQGAWLAEHGLGGYILWGIDLDDVSGRHCGQGKNPIQHAIINGIDPQMTTTTPSGEETYVFEYEDDTPNEGKHFAHGQVAINTPSSEETDVFDYEDETPNEGKHFAYEEVTTTTPSNEETGVFDYEDETPNEGKHFAHQQRRVNKGGNTVYVNEEDRERGTTLNPDGVDYFMPQYDYPQLDPGPHEPPEGPQGIPERPPIQVEKPRAHHFVGEVPILPSGRHWYPSNCMSILVEIAYKINI